MYKKDIERLFEDKKMQKVICALPDNIYFDVDYFDSGQVELGTQADTQAEVAAVKDAIKTSFPGMVWKRQYYEDLKTWTYQAKQENVRFCIYAVKEAPPRCKAVRKTRTVVKEVPVQFEEREVEEEYIEWDCSNDKEGK